MANDLYNDLPLTSFPQNIDSFTTWLNVTAQDGPLIQQYITAMNAGNQAQANQILSQISSGSQKIIKATDLNKLTQAILAVERFYSTDIEPYIQNQQENWLNIINQFSYVGAWSNGTAYVQNNIVSYIVSGVTLLFIATSNPPTGTVPTNTQYWRPLSVQGTAGESGPGLSYRQEWNSSTPYSVNDCVTYSGAVWMALQDNQNIIPGQNESYWKNIISFGTVAYPIQDTEPTGQSVGSLWFNTQDSPTKYVYLEPLNNPAGTDQILQGYEAYDGQGYELTGNLVLPVVPPALPNPTNIGNLTPTQQGSNVQLSNTFQDANTIEEGTVVNYQAPLSSFGNATASDVATGKTFTSESGLEINGTRGNIAEPIAIQGNFSGFPEIYWKATPTPSIFLSVSKNGITNPVFVLDIGYSIILPKLDYYCEIPTGYTQYKIYFKVVDENTHWSIYIYSDQTTGALSGLTRYQLFDGNAIIPPAPDPLL